eukprot:6260535-Prymnesium_polylepis.1
MPADLARGQCCADRGVRLHELSVAAKASHDSASITQVGPPPIVRQSWLQDVRVDSHPSSA